MIEREFVVELLKSIEKTMKSEIQKKDIAFSLEDGIREIASEADEYLFLRFYDAEIDTDQFIINYIRFISSYTSDLGKINRTFERLMKNVKLLSQMMMSTPALRYLYKQDKNSFLSGFLTDRPKG